MDNSTSSNSSPYYTKMRNRFVMLCLLLYLIYMIFKIIQISHRVTIKYSYPTMVYDDTDIQWRNFRKNIPLFIVLIFVYIVLKEIILWIVDWIYSKKINSSLNGSSNIHSPVVNSSNNAPFHSPHASSNASKSTITSFTSLDAAALAGTPSLAWSHSATSSIPIERISMVKARVKQIYYAIANIFILYFVHGSDFFVALLPFATLIYLISSVFKRSKWSIILTWALCLSGIWICEYHLENWLGGTRGIYRLSVAFNISILRLISFVHDRWEINTSQSIHESSQKSSSSSNEHLRMHTLPNGHVDVDPSKKPSSCPFAGTLSKDHPLSYSSRVKYGSRSDSEFDFISYLAYLFYIPLYVSGPITTFNAFNSHLKISQRNFSKKQIFAYVLRTGFSFLVFEFSQYYIHTLRLLNLFKNGMRAMSVVEVGSLAFFSLVFVYMKFNFIWKFFRLAALLDGIEVPENMERCVINTYGLTEFWRNWHASMNRWVTRYVYIPLGGNRKGGIRKLVSVMIVFTFIAVWHDIKLQLLSWGWLITLIYIPEIFFKILTSRWRSRWWYDWLSAMGTGFILVVLMFANVIGFVFGLEGLNEFYISLKKEGFFPIIITIITTPFAVMIQYEIRKYEQYFNLRRANY